MGIQSPSATFTRFFVPEPLTEDFWEYVDERLKSGCFKECEPDQEQSSGFSSWDDFLEAEFDYGSYHMGEYVAFHFRRDHRKIPAVVLKQHVREAVRKFRSQNGGKWPPRQEKLHIQEEVQNWLLGRVLPQPSACEVVWNPGKKLMLLGTTSTKVLDVFLEKFEQHFHLYPVPLFHANWALHQLALDERKKDALQSLVSVKSPNAMADGRFLGHEFLTWLWFFTESSPEPFRIAGDKAVEAHLGERLVLCLPDNGKERVICTTQGSQLSEARTALRQGKLVQEAQLLIKVADAEYLLTLDCSLWGFKGLKTPKQLPDEGEHDAEGRFLEKMSFLEEVFASMDFLYQRFLAERLSSAWQSDALPLLNKWMNGAQG
jgi:hypothetical protein